MATVPRHWPHTWPAGNVCQFSIERAEENAQYLETLFGRSWLAKGVTQPLSSKEHAVISAWRWGGGEPFLDLNALAEDLRTVKGTPGLAGVLREMKQPKSYAPTRHMLRSAALMARGGNSLAKFFAAGSDTVPDFEALVAGLRTPVEAKLLTQSQPWRTFCSKASELQNTLIGALYPDGTNHAVTKIVVKAHDRIPPISDVIEAVEKAREAFDGQGGEHRGELLNVFLAPPPSASQAADFVSVQIMTPRSDTEETRVEQLVKKANRQLRNNANEVTPGLMCLSITQHQDPHTLVRYLNRKFADQQFRSISGILLHRPANHRGPSPILVLDQLAYVQNPNAFLPLPPFRIQAVGGAPQLLDNPPPENALSCYAVGIASARILAGDTYLGLSIPTVLLSDVLQ